MLPQIVVLEYTSLLRVPVLPYAGEAGINGRGLGPAIAEMSFTEGEWNSLTIGGAIKRMNIENR